MIQRRSFLFGLVGAFAAPAIVRAGSLMPVRSIPLVEPGDLNLRVICEMLKQANDIMGDYPQGITYVETKALNLGLLRPGPIFTWQGQDPKLLRVFKVSWGSAVPERIHP